MTCSLAPVSRACSLAPVSWGWMPVMNRICVQLFLLCYFIIHRIGRKFSFSHLKGGGVSFDSAYGHVPNIIRSCSTIGPLITTGVYFSHQNESHTAKLSFSTVLMHFCGNLQKKHLLGQKKWFSRQNDPHTAKLSFSDIFKHFWGKWQKKIV